ncbi:hypothetical protein J2X48_000735 [Bosea sp. BE271]|uniref:hypothetical protein n=1 Tax=Bosea TaxID=85413 RepID=UPI0028590777|nr:MULTISPECIES: hypothetical protein [Bosea]MDR6826461.1 hypothetical protein [Bosea robiniae]MDR6893171.1 hypothetical protein [Bosea sp. BE109]MDR7137130.1 hypothetical protein [Bosea sp. BE168]MDR7173829.1 hypothetical protein [Bosea sp. BE271]
MKLSPEQIGTIEALLTLREKGVTDTEIGRRLEMGKYGQQYVGGAFATLTALGFPVRQVGRGGNNRKPAAKAIKPAARSRGAAKSSTRQPRVFLTADQWQDRLSAMGH